MENRKFDVTALGELLIDFTENGNSSQGNPLMEANPGGAPVTCSPCWNVLAKRLLHRQSRQRHVWYTVKDCC